MSTSAVIVTHKFKTGSACCKNEIKEMRDYMAREGRFEYKGGLDRSITDSDLHLMELKRYRDVHELVNYCAREGRYKGRGKDMPLKPGEVSGHCFGRDGVYSADSLEREILDSGSNVMTSVVSIRRDEAAALGMDSKEAFENLLRLHWDRVVAEFGIIAPSDVEWRAFYHVDNPKSLHVHVITWDKSGRWHNDDKRQVPVRKQNIGLRYINDVVTRGLRNRTAAEKSYLRDAIITRIKEHLGYETNYDRVEKLNSRQENLECPYSAIPHKRIDDEQGWKLLKSVADASPTGRVLQYARSPKEVREAAKNVVEALRSEDKELDKMFARYEQVITMQAEMRWHKDRIYRDETGKEYNDLKSYIAQARYDLERRAASAVCTQTRHTHDRLDDNFRLRDIAIRTITPTRRDKQRAEKTIADNIPASTYKQAHDEWRQGYKDYKQGNAEKAHEHACNAAHTLVDDELLRQHFFAYIQQQYNRSNGQNVHIQNHFEMEDKATDRLTTLLEKEYNQAQTARDLSLASLTISLTRTVAEGFAKMRGDFSSKRFFSHNKYHEYGYYVGRISRSIDRSYASSHGR